MIREDLQVALGEPHSRVPTSGGSRVERRGQPFAEQRDAQHRHGDRDAGHRRHVPRGAQQGAAAGDHRAPAREVGVAEAEEGERALDQDRDRDRHGR